MKTKNVTQFKRQRRHRRIRSKIMGTADRPRLCVFKSAKHIYAQIVDDTEGRTLAAASSLKLGSTAAAEVSKKKAQAEEVGRAIAEVAKKHGITRVRFDRGGYRYHGRVAALAESARQNGLKF